MDQNNTDNHEKDSQKRQKNPNPTAQLVLIIKNLRKVIYKKEHTNKHTPPTDKKFSDGRKLNWLTLALVLVNAALAAATYFLYREAANQSQYAKDAAASVRESVKDAQENFRIENRAWVGVDQEPNLPFGSMFDDRLYMSVKNFGKTPAESVCVSIHRFLGKAKFVIPTHTFNAPQVFSPNQTIIYHIDDVLGADSLRMLTLHGDLLVYVYGIITYKDLYGGIDSTKFMFRFTPNEEILPVAGYNRMK